MGEDAAGRRRGCVNREAARPIVTNLGDRIVKTTGDGVLLEFPLIVAAVECATVPSFVQPKRTPPISG